MSTARFVRRLLSRSFIRGATCIAIIGQLAVLLGSIADERDGAGSRAHVEQGGTSAHYAHSDSCGLCQARSLHGLSVASPQLPPAVVVDDEPSASVGSLAVAADLRLPSLSRAPPRVS